MMALTPKHLFFSIHSIFALFFFFFFFKMYDTWYFVLFWQADIHHIPIEDVIHDLTLHSLFMGGRICHLVETPLARYRTEY